MLTLMSQMSSGAHGEYLMFGIEGDTRVDLLHLLSIVEVQIIERNNLLGYNTMNLIFLSQL